MGILGIIVTILKLIAVLAVVATVHEIGHFTFAKIFKMNVKEFGIGFGKPIFKKTYKGTIYSLRWIPLGGFCALEGEEGESTDDNAFYKKAAWKRIVVLLAGATFNAILAIIIFLGVNIQTPTYTTVVSEISTNSSLYKAGIRTGDNITKVNNKKVKIFQELDMYNETSKVPSVEYIRDGKKYSTKVEGAIYEIGTLGAYFISDKDGIITSEIDLIEGGSAAQKAKLKSGDKIVSIGGVETTLYEDVIKVAMVNAGKEIDIVISRDGKIENKKITPEGQTIVNVSNFTPKIVKTNIKYAAVKAKSMFVQIVSSYGDLFKGKVKVTQMSGILGIGEIVSKTDGFLDFINLMGIISLAIGIANVMPFPPLDGGKIVIVLIEVITRKRVNEKVEIVLSYIGLALLLSLTLYITYNDIVRIFF